MKAKPKLFTVSSRNPDQEPPVVTRLIRAQTLHQVEKFLEGEALHALRTRLKVEVATMDEAIELTGAGVKPEDLPEQT